jgi:hypothetical protein
MNDTKLAQTIAQAIALDREIAEKSDQLKNLKALLAAEAESRADQATPTEGGGTSTELAGADGCICRVTVAGRTLKSSIKAEGKDIVKIKDVAGRSFARLFETVLGYKPVADFRDHAVSELGAKDGTKLIRLLESPGKTTVSFETKEAGA